MACVLARLSSGGRRRLVGIARDRTRSIALLVSSGDVSGRRMAIHPSQQVSFSLDCINKFAPLV